MKTCTKCKVRQSIESFYKTKYNKHGLQFWCKSCFKTQTAEYQRKDPTRSRRFQLKHKYGITLEERYQILSSQDYLCAICKCELELAIPHLDHDKETGQLRGILCSRCNQGFGLFAESIEFLQAAIAYKIKWSY